MCLLNITKLQLPSILFCFTRGWNSRIQNILCDDSIISRHLPGFRLI